ncbi:MAG TPA: DUF547 domain-containing protein [Herpetosiphonaceae bacterium]
MPAPTPTKRTAIVEQAVWLVAAAWGWRPRIGPLQAGAGAGRFQHSEWTALLGRFVQNAAIDYATMRRVRRLVEVYLHRLAEDDPERFADADDQLAFYLNAYNAIAIHQVLLHYPVASIRAIPGARTRPYPVGRRNVSLQTLHGSILRAFGDPRIHAAISTTARGGAQIQPQAFTGSNLQRALDTAMRRLLHDNAHGARLDPATNTLYLSSIFRSFGGDFLQPQAMPGPLGLLAGWRHRAGLVPLLRPYMPPDLAIAMQQTPPQVRFLPYDWTINDRLFNA